MSNDPHNSCDRGRLWIWERGGTVNCLSSRRKCGRQSLCDLTTYSYSPLNIWLEKDCTEVDITLHPYLPYELHSAPFVLQHCISPAGNRAVQHRLSRLTAARHGCVVEILCSSPCLIYDPGSCCTYCGTYVTTS